VSGPRHAVDTPSRGDHAACHDRRVTTIRQATIADLDTAADLFVQYLAFYEVDAAPEKARDYLAARLEAGDSLVLLAADDAGVDVGLAQVYPTFASLDLAASWLLSDLFVAPAARGTGVGRALLREVVARAAAAGAAWVTLETAHTNTTAQGLYESEGFEHDLVYRVYARSLTTR